MKQYLIAALIGAGIVACMLVMFIIGRERGYGQGYSDAMNQPHKADTVWRTDTIIHETPVEKWKTIEKPVYIAVVDSQIVHIHDTTYIALNREIKGYSDTDYQCEISGIEPNLNWIKVFPKTAYITNTIVEKKRWSFGITAGPGVLYNGSVQFGVGAVVGFGYNF